jgi:hypothetical protein
VISGPDGPVEVLTTGEGEPVTLFVPGLTGSIAQTRPFGSGVTGTRVFAHLSGHGATVLPVGAPVGYTQLADQVRAVADGVRATRAVGVSMGAGALLAALVAPGAPHLRRMVLCLPPAAPGDPPSAPAVIARFAAMADALDAADVEGLAGLLREHQPAAIRRTPAVVVWARRHAHDLVAGRDAGLAAVLRAVPGQVPVADAATLPDPGAAPDTLVIAQEDDEVHPVGPARAWAKLLGARLEVLPPGSIPWRGRDRLRTLITGHLNG